MTASDIMTPETQFLAILVATGIILIIAEIYLPGAVAGILGGLCLVSAIFYGFANFGPVNGAFITAGIMALTCGLMIFWLKYFPKTSMGRKITLEHDLGGAKSAGSLGELLGKQGEALSELRPAGFATIEKKRVDVVTQGEMIARGEKVRVVEVKGNRVVVAKAKKE